MRLLLLLPLLMFSGCFRFYVNAPNYRPIPPEIDKPSLPMDLDGDGEVDELNDREELLMQYANELSDVYNSVRADTIEHNKSAGFPVPEE